MLRSPCVRLRSDRPAAMSQDVSTFEINSGVAAIRYVDVDWPSLKAVEGHPLEFVLNLGIPVYYKIDRAIHAPLITSRLFLDRMPSELHSNTDKDPPSLPFVGFSERLLLVQLDDADVHEILLTGSRHVEEFVVGGLGIDDPQTLSGAASAGLVDIDFQNCRLINRKRLRAAEELSRHPGFLRNEDYADALQIGFSDLYLEASDVNALANIKRGTGVERQPYPLGAEGRQLPQPINWVFQAWYAVYREKEIEPTESNIKSWLRANAPGKIMNKRWIRTAASLILCEYKFSERFNLRNLTQCSAAAIIFELNLSSQLASALVITEWWMDLDKADISAQRVELAGRLEDAGFLPTAVLDLTGMISEEAVGEVERPHFERALDTLQKRKGRDQLKVSGGTAPAAKSEASPIEQLEPENSAVANVVPDSEEEPLECPNWDGRRPFAPQL